MNIRVYAHCMLKITEVFLGLWKNEFSVSDIKYATTVPCTLRWTLKYNESHWNFCDSDLSYNKFTAGLSEVSNCQNGAV